MGLHVRLGKVFAERIRANPKISGALEKIAGTLLVGFGLKLALSQ